jgi:hypothetical protein
MSTPVRREQFGISSKGITHAPTGAKYTPHPGAPYSSTMNLGLVALFSLVGIVLSLVIAHFGFDITTLG